ncbi:hypothetical protein [Mangrovitalea sediminis]|uniref:hypothetical protein n=1 Tax=Mangrovitalea sediminis TaxID=1982043 RepID=UPI001178AE6A|nr:hypothetical protein [Mangrovitalea sediminis]
MRSTLTFQRLCFLFLLSLTLAGCKKQQSADTPTILGLPSTVAYLGVDYYYDFGAYGGDNLLTYSLSNAPSWMALENTTNKVRPGIILHGVPGITGGRLGSADLGQFKNIGIYATDGSLLGGSTFNVQVKWNALSLSPTTTVTEGKAYEPASTTSSKNATTNCDMPATDVTGTLTDTGITTYDSSGAAIGLTQKTFKTYPIVIPVTLTKPSVEPVAVAFQLTSKYNYKACKQGATPHPPGQPQDRGCEFSDTNRQFAQLKRDVVASTGTLPSTPSYLSYNADQLSGLLTIPAGKSTCYIRLEVTDDDFAELPETFSLNLTEVRQGLASFSTSDGGQDSDVITIQDNEPTVTFSTTSDYVSKGTSAEYTAHLSAAQTVDTSVYLGADTTTTLSASDYSFEDATGQPLPYNKLVFPAGLQDVNFKVAIKNPLSSSGSFIDDRLLTVFPDMFLGFGRSNFAGAGTNAYIDIYVNEWLSRTQVGSSGGFEPESMAVGDSGHVFLGGADGGKLNLKMYDRTGVDQTSTELQPSALSFPGNQTNVRLAYGSKSIKVSSSTSISRRELAIGFSTDTAIGSSFTQSGGTDVAVSLLKRDDSASTYTNEWSYQSGSSANDTLTSIGLDANNNVYLGGETTGSWGGVTPKGGNDIFLELLNNGSTVGSTTWSTLLGTSTDETLAALLPLGTNVYPVGTTSGYLATQDNNGPYGGVDGFFENLSSPADTPKIYQFGTSQDDLVKAAAFGTGQQLWVIGDGYANYVAASNNQFQDPPTISNALNGFVATYSTSRALLGVTTLSDSNALANIHLTAIVPHGETAFIGGYIDTGGSFQDGVTAQHQDLILAELDNSTRGTISETWRLQQDDGIDERVVALGLYNGRKLVALVRQGADGVGPYTYQIRTYKLDGTELTKP